MIEVKGVIKDYRSGDTVVHALRGVDINIDKGEFISIAGPSGSGKTTLLNIIGCIDNLDQGSVTIEGKEVGILSKKEKSEYRREALGFIFQSYNLIPVLTAYENVEFSLSLTDVEKKEKHERVMTMLNEVGLADMADRIPSRLSGGQQQRVAIARALIKQPKIILADEPTANLDSHTGEDVLALMRKMNEKHGTTFIFSTHDRIVMDYAKRLVMLHDGKISSDKRQ